ncbi:MAG TPA: HAMP domain-containing sensor histidine kinase [Vicinamibacterales bacterium]|nr:HAMP domain-containing sensor histidine kinase [Vicinamibacterales bacterium]
MPMHWYRSLYWRIAFGVVAFLAAMLVVQAVFFVWAVSQSGRTLPGQSPARLGQTVALDLASTLERDPQADLIKYVHDQYASYTHPFFVMMADGRVITSGSKSFPEPLLRMARARLQAPPRGPRFEGPVDPAQARPRADAAPPIEGPRPDGPRPNRPFDAAQGRPRPRADREAPDRFVDRLEFDATGSRFVRPSPILVAGHLAGVVVVPPQAPFGFLLSRFAPTLGLVAGAVLIVGTVLTSLMIFGPARRRLRAVEHAARQFGSGDLSARAPEKGGDEIAAVAHAFNTMADDLAASDRVRRQLLADVSHELKTPVTAISGYLETMTMPELALDEGTRGRYLTIIADETRRLEQLIGDLLDLARLEGGGGALRHDPVPVDQLFDRVAARHGRACETAGVRLETSIDPSARTVVGDRDRLEQALQNLAANAMRYAPGGTAIQLRAEPAGAPPAVSIAVTDQGPGIAPEHVPHVFDRFYKADASRAGVSGGSGLGLSIVKAIVERHGGRITVDSRPGRTTFVMELRGASSAPAHSRL